MNRFYPFWFTMVKMLLICGILSMFWNPDCVTFMVYCGERHDYTVCFHWSKLHAISVDFMFEQTFRIFSRTFVLLVSLILLLLEIANSRYCFLHDYLQHCVFSWNLSKKIPQITCKAIFRNCLKRFCVYIKEPLPSGWKTFAFTLNI